MTTVRMLASRATAERLATRRVESIVNGNEQIRWGKNEAEKV
jgi:hypothetical protein